MEDLLNDLQNETECLLRAYQDLKSRNRELLDENQLLHEKLLKMQGKQSIAGSKVDALLRQFKSLQEES